jgi:hypothetical protein
MMGRRLALSSFAAVAALIAACDDDDVADGQARSRPPREEKLPEAGAFSDNVDALFDVLIPGEHDADGKLLSPGAREAGANEVLALDRFAALAVALGLVPPLADDARSRLEKLGAALRTTVDAELDVLAIVERPGTRFRDLPRPSQERIVERALVTSPLVQVARAAAFTAYLGAVRSDVGLRAIGYPPFEDHEGGLAVSGYPRTTDGQVDDYTYNALPPGAGVDLAGILDERGDLL